MAKFRKAILILGILVIVVAAALGTYLVLSFSGAIATDPVELVFNVENREKEYDGKPLTPDSYVLLSGELSKGHHAVVEYSGSQTEVGEGQGDMTVKILDENDYDVSKKYAVKVNKGLLVVEKCEVYIRLDEAKAVYNGENVLFDNYVLATGSLAEGHCLGAAKKTGTEIISVNQTLTEEDVAPAVYDEKGKDVSENYHLNFRMGEIKVLPRPLSLKPVNAEKTYDGTELTFEEFEIVSGSLVAGHRAEVEYETEDGEAASILNAEELKAYVANVVIYDADGDEVTENYDLDLTESGTLTILKRDLILTAKNGEWEYDGTEHSLAEDDHEAESCDGLLENDEVYVEYEGAITNVGKAENAIVKYFITDQEGLDNGSYLDSKNYNVICANGTLTVTPKQVTVEMTDSEKPYDGKAIALDEIPFESDVIVRILESSLADKVDAGVYESTARFDDEGGNYKITVKSGRFEILPIDVTLGYGGTLTKIYDGKPFEVDESKITLSGDGSEAFEVVSVAYDKVVKVADNAPLNLRYPRLVDKNTGRDVDAKNFNASWAASYSVTIAPKSIILTAETIIVQEENEWTIGTTAQEKYMSNYAALLADGDYFADDSFEISGWTFGTVVYVKNLVIYNSLGETITNCYTLLDIEGKVLTNGDELAGQVVIVPKP